MPVDALLPKCEIRQPSWKRVIFSHGQQARATLCPSPVYCLAWSTQTYSMLLPRRMRFPKLAVGELLLYSTAPSKIMFIWLSQSIILPRYSMSFFSLMMMSEFSFFTKRFNGFLDGSIMTTRIECHTSLDSIKEL
jgi:hypothetical protein